MARTIGICFVLAASALASASASDDKDGIYVLAEHDGGKIELGERLATDFGTVTITATNNDNSRFWLHLEGAGPFPAEATNRRLVVHVAGQSMPVSGWSKPNDARRMELSARVDGLEAARRVGRALGVEPRLREHPGHRLIVRVRPKAAVVRVGEPVELTLEIENAGTAPFSFMDGGMQRGARNNQFSFIAHRGAGSGPAIPDTGDPRHFGGMAAKRSLAPGARFKKEIALDKWFRFEKPDTYRITAVFRLAIETAGALPWDEFAVGECDVRVVARR